MKSLAVLISKRQAKPSKILAQWEPLFCSALHLLWTFHADTIVRQGESQLARAAWTAARFLTPNPVLLAREEAVSRPLLLSLPLRCSF